MEDRYVKQAETGAALAREASHSSLFSNSLKMSTKSEASKLTQLYPKEPSNLAQSNFSKGHS